MTRVLTVPGWQSSGPEHWQTKWEQLDATITRVEQDDWETPQLADWRARLEARLAASREPTVLAAHSLGCLLVAHARPHVAGALLVAPPDLERLELPQLKSFLPVPRARLPFPAVLVASRDDPFADLERSRALAADWGAEFVDAGARGHLNSASGLGTWPEGRAWLRGLVQRSPFALDARLANDTVPVARGPLSLLLLMNDARYPWFVLVPQRSGVHELGELTSAEQQTLAHEGVLVSAAMTAAFSPDKLNVGALGNVVRQLHVHFVARTLGDPAWPGPVWGHSPRVPRPAAMASQLVDRLFAHAPLAAHFERTP